MVISLVGTWMQSIAQSWLIYRLTHSEFLLGATWFCGQFPILVLAPLGGLAADRFPRHRIVLVTQILSMIQALLLAALTLSGHIRPWHVLVFAAALGAINAFDIPGRQSLFVELTSKDDLLNAISLNSTVFNLARVAGPSVGGFVVAAFGEGICFLVNGLSFIAVIGSFLAMRIPPSGREMATGGLRRLVEGFRYANQSKPLRVILGMSGAVNIACAPAVTLAPFFADAIFHFGSRGLGFLTGSMGLGAVAGTLSLARRDRVTGLPTVMLTSGLLLAASLILFAGSPFFAISLVAMFALGVSVFRQNASANTLIQTMIDDDYRGRIMSIYSMVVIGFLPFGSLASGALAQHIGPRWTVLLGGLMCLAASLIYRALLPGFRKWTSIA